MSFLFKKNKYNVFKNMNDDMYKTKLQNIINYHNIEITNLNDIIIQLKTANDTLRKEIYSLKQTIPSDKEYCIMNQQQIDNFMKKLKVILKLLLLNYLN